MNQERTDRLSRALLAVYDVVTRTDEAVAPALREYGITSTTAYLLWLIDPTEEPPSMKAAAERMGCTPQNVTFMCQQLEAKGLVRRVQSAADRRQRVIELTERGRAAREAVVVLASTESPFATAPLRTLEQIAALLDELQPPDVRR